VVFRRGTGDVGVVSEHECAWHGVTGHPQRGCGSWNVSIRLHAQPLLLVFLVPFTYDYTMLVNFYLHVCKFTCKHYMFTVPKFDSVSA
jgi:hypothetical protein